MLDSIIMCLRIPEEGMNQAHFDLIIGLLLVSATGKYEHQSDSKNFHYIVPRGNLSIDVSVFFATLPCHATR
mgnify:CR=1 FL=1